MKNTVLFLFFVFYGISCFSQDTIYYNNKKEKLDSKKEAYRYKIKTINPTDTTKYSIRTYSMSHVLRSERNYYHFKSKDKEKRYKDGSKRSWYKTGQLKHEENYKLNKLDGPMLSYWEDGTLRREASYQNDKLLTGKCYTKEGIDTLFYSPQEKPTYKGGIKKLYNFLGTELIYPKASKKKKSQGRVITHFIVGKDGHISDIKIIKSSGDPLLDKEAIRVIEKMPKWDPGKRNGKPVKVKYTLPIVFKLNSDE